MECSTEKTIFGEKLTFLTPFYWKVMWYSGPLKTHLTLIMYVITTSLPHICEMDKLLRNVIYVRNIGRQHITNVMRVKLRGENVRRTQMRGTNIHVRVDRFSHIFKIFHLLNSERCEKNIIICFQNETRLSQHTLLGSIHISLVSLSSLGRYFFIQVTSAEIILSHFECIWYYYITSAWIE